MNWKRVCRIPKNKGGSKMNKQLIGGQKTVISRRRKKTQHYRSSRIFLSLQSCSIVAQYSDTVSRYIRHQLRREDLPTIGALHWVTRRYTCKMKCIPMLEKEDRSKRGKYVLQVRTLWLESSDAPEPHIDAKYTQNQRKLTFQSKYCSTRRPTWSLYGIYIRPQDIAHSGMLDETCTHQDRIGRGAQIARYWEESTDHGWWT